MNKRIAYILFILFYTITQYAQSNGELIVEAGVVLYSGIGLESRHTGIPETHSQFNGGYLKIGLDKRHHLRGQFLVYADGTSHSSDEGHGELEFEGWMFSMGYEYEYKIWRMISGNVGWQFFWNENDIEGWWIGGRPREIHNYNLVTCEYGVRAPLGINIEIFSRIRLTAEWFFRISQRKNEELLGKTESTDVTSWNGQGRGVITLGIRI